MNGIYMRPISHQNLENRLRGGKQSKAEPPKAEPSNAKQAKQSKAKEAKQSILYGVPGQVPPRHNRAK